jgi:hypothetical protein
MGTYAVEKKPESFTRFEVKGYLTTNFLMMG